MGAPFVHLSVDGDWPIQAHITALLSFRKKMYKVGLTTDHFKIWNSTYQLHSFAFMYPQQEPLSQSDGQNLSQIAQRRNYYG